MASQQLCVLHNERLQLFCVEHQELVCIICEKSRSHDKHRMKPVNEAALDYKEDVKRTLEPLKRKLEVHQKAKEKFEGGKRHINAQAVSTEGQIREAFRKIRQCLAEEEEARISRLRADALQTSRPIQEKIQALGGQTAALSNAITAAEQKLRANDHAFLQDYKTTVEGMNQQRRLAYPPKLLSGALLDQRKHLNNLGTSIQQKIKDLTFDRPVILDLNTVDPDPVEYDPVANYVATAEEDAQCIALFGVNCAEFNDSDSNYWKSMVYWPDTD